jgi:hypothetical protein
VQSGCEIKKKYRDIKQIENIIETSHPTQVSCRSGNGHPMKILQNPVLEIPKFRRTLNTTTHRPTQSTVNHQISTTLNFSDKFTNNILQNPHFSRHNSHRDIDMSNIPSELSKALMLKHDYRPQSALEYVPNRKIHIENKTETKSEYKLNTMTNQDFTISKLNREYERIKSGRPGTCI